MREMSSPLTTSSLFNQIIIHIPIKSKHARQHTNRRHCGLWAHDLNCRQKLSLQRSAMPSLGSYRLLPGQGPKLAPFWGGWRRDSQSPALLVTPATREDPKPPARNCRRKPSVAWISRKRNHSLSPSLAPTLSRAPRHSLAFLQGNTTKQ